MSSIFLRRMALGGALLTLVVIASGGLVSATGSGTACAEWPLCSEAVVGPAAPLAWLALGHRALVLVAMLVALLNAVLALRWDPSDHLARVTLVLAPLFGALQVGMGAVLVELRLFGATDGTHLALALLMLACQAVGWAALSQPASEIRMGGRAARQARRLSRLAWWTAGATGVLALALNAQTGANPAASATALLPTNAVGALIMTGLMAGALLWQTARQRRMDRVVLGGVVAMAGLSLSVAPTLLLPTTASGLGLGLAAALWGTALSVAVLMMRRPVPLTPELVVTARAEAERKPSLISDYVSLTKPKVISLLLVTTAAAMYITEAGAPALSLVFWTMVGGYLAAGGAGAINCAFDGDIDINMGRTSRRPVPSGRISQRNALIFGLSLSLLAIVVLLVFTTPLAALFAGLGIVYYAWLYTQWLKRSTWQNIVVGGGAGAIPPLVGWTAVTGQISLAAVLLFAIIFYWTPPHFWALALVKQKDYARAGVPMLPVVAGEQETRWQILVYSLLLVALSIMLTLIGAMGWLYLVLAVALGALFLRYAWAVWQQGDQASIWGLYKYSLLYLALLFAAMVVDRMLVLA